jgi:hypothetical protein
MIVPKFIFIKTKFMTNGKYIYLSIMLMSTLFTLGSCECYQNVEGVVLDKKTNKPIDSVMVQKIDRGIGEFSDSTGAFKIHANSGGIFGCPLMKISLTKSGYYSDTTEIDNAGSKTIYLTKK